VPNVEGPCVKTNHHSPATTVRVRYARPITPADTERQPALVQAVHGIARQHLEDSTAIFSDIVVSDCLIGAHPILGGLLIQLDPRGPNGRRAATVTCVSIRQLEDEILPGLQHILDALKVRAETLGDA